MKYRNRAGIQTLCALLSAAAFSLHSAEPEAVKAAIDQDGVQRVRVVAGNYFFKPAHIIVKAGTPVELTVVKEPGMTPHDFVVRSPGAGVSVEQSLTTDPVKVTFTPKAAGKYAFYCSNKLVFMKSHREQGMEGMLEVVD